MMRKLLVFSILAAVLFCGDCNEGDEDTSCVKTGVNEYLDKVLEKARQELPDPMRLPPRSSFVELSDGVLWGLSNLTRSGEAEVTCDGNTITIKSKITTDELKGRYTWTKGKKHPREGYFVFISDDFEADIEVAIEKKEGEVTHPRLERFVIKKFKDAKIEISGGSYLGWALGEVTTLMSGIFSRAIAHAIQGPVEEALERQMREINIQ